MQTSTWILSGTAAVLVAASTVTRLVVYPAVHQVPSDTDTTFEYAGRASLLNAKALESGDTANAFLTDLPITLTRRVQVVDTDGRTAVVTDNSVITGQDKTVLTSTAHRWAIDRRDLDERPAPKGAKVEAHQGLVVSWPLEPEKHDYTFWDPTTATEVPAVYQRSEKLKGRDVYVYEIKAAGPLADPAVSKRLPVALPRNLLAGIAATLPAGQRPDASALGALPDPVPLTYAATVKRTAWIDTETGTVLNGSLDQTIVAQTAGPSGPVTLAPVNSVVVKGTDKSVTDRADDAESAARNLWLIRVVGPLGLLGAAVLVAALAVWRELRGRKSRRSADETPSAAEATSAD